MAEWAGSGQGVSCTLSFTLMSSSISYTTPAVLDPTLTWIKGRSSGLHQWGPSCAGQCDNMSIKKFTVEEDSTVRDQGLNKDLESFVLNHVCKTFCN